MSKRYTVNLNVGRPHTIHRLHPWEVCNSDSADKTIHVDRTEADEMLGSGSATQCQHCLAEGLDYDD